MVRCDCAVCAGIVLLVAGVADAGDGELRYRVVALQGQAAPGGSPGTTFARFSSPFNNGDPRPGIDAAGNQSLFALVAGGSGQGVFAETGGTLRALALTGQHAPGTEASFAEFPAIETPGTPLISAGRSLFVATLSGPNVFFGNRHGTWSDRSGVLELVVRAGDPAPGMSGVTLGDPLPLAFNEQGRTLIAARLEGAGVTTANNESLWTDRSGAMSLFVREAQAAPGTEAGVVFGFGQLGAGQSVFPATAMNAESRIVFGATLSGPGITAFNDEALYLETSQGVELLVREGEDAPGAGHRVTFGGNSVALFLRLHGFNSAGQLTFSLRLGGHIPTTDAIFSTHTGALTQVVRAGQPAPGTGASFTIMGPARLSESGRVAFLASTAPGVVFFPPMGLWWDQHGSIQALLLPGSSPPGLEGATLAGMSQIVGYTASGQIAVGAGVMDPELGPQSVLLLIDPDGRVRKVAASGERFNADGQGNLRTVEIIVPGGLSETGEVAFRLRFTDGTEGHYGASVGAGCYANCDGSPTPPVLNVADFTCFLQRFAAVEPYANCDGSTQTPVLNVGDFTCFLQRFAAGCP
jgi:hypothetical protein